MRKEGTLVVLIDSVQASFQLGNPGFFLYLEAKCSSTSGLAASIVPRA